MYNMSYFEGEIGSNFKPSQVLYFYIENPQI
jgi:hypothetical protein